MNELEVENLIKEKLENVHIQALPIVHKREIFPNGIGWVAYYVVRVKRTQAVDALIALSTLARETNDNVVADGTDSTIVEGTFEHDYIIIRAKIRRI